MLAFGGISVFLYTSCPRPFPVNIVSINVPNVVFFLFGWILNSNSNALNWRVFDSFNIELKKNLSTRKENDIRYIEWHIRIKCQNLSVYIKTNRQLRVVYTAF